MMQKFGLVTDYLTLLNSKINNEGRQKVTKGKEDKDVLKMGRLRNIAGTYLYFHDGSIAGLDSEIKIMGRCNSLV